MRATLACLFFTFAVSSVASAFTANKVWFEFLSTGIYRVHVAYTVPELKEFRESIVEFKKKKEAERFYWDLVKGADFHPSNPNARRFVNQPAEADPW